MVVCHCKVVNDNTIRTMISSNCQTVRDITDRCGAGADCGSCVKMIQHLITSANNR